MVTIEREITIKFKITSPTDMPENINPGMEKALVDKVMHEIGGGLIRGSKGWPLEVSLYCQTDWFEGMWSMEIEEPKEDQK